MILVVRKNSIWHSTSGGNSRLALGGVRRFVLNWQTITKRTVAELACEPEKVKTCTQYDLLEDCVS